MARRKRARSTHEIIGRREELLALEGFLEAVPAGGPALLLEGDTGIGKTVLWQRRSSPRRASGASASSRRARPNPSCRSHSRRSAICSHRCSARRCRGCCRFSGARSRSRFCCGSPTDRRRRRGCSRPRCSRSFANSLGRDHFSIAVDDVQWVDASSAEILGFMLRRLEDEPVGVLATVRGRPVEAPLGLDRAFPGFRRLPGRPGVVGAIHRLLWGRLALNLPRPVARARARDRGGNPFFALELGRAVVAGTIRADGADVALPESLRALVAERLGELPREYARRS